MSIKGAIKSANFPSSSKLADVTLWHKKWRKDIKENFWPLSTETSSKNVDDDSTGGHTTMTSSDVFRHRK